MLSQITKISDSPVRMNHSNKTPSSIPDSFE
jgi:hypothetical protein